MCGSLPLLMNEEREQLQRVLKVACRIILKNDYINYNQVLQILDLLSLSDRRQMLAKRFASKCVKDERFKDIFPRNENNLGLRSGEKYLVKFCKSDRLQRSSIPLMQKLLNKP